MSQYQSSVTITIKIPHGQNQKSKMSQVQEDNNNNGPENIRINYEIKIPVQRRRLLRLQNNNSYTDIVINCNDGLLRIHSILLHASSDPLNPFSMDNHPHFCSGPNERPHRIINTRDVSIQWMSKIVFLYYLGITTIKKSNYDLMDSILDYLHADKKKIGKCTSFLFENEPNDTIRKILSRYRNFWLRYTSKKSQRDCYISFSFSNFKTAKPNVSQTLLQPEPEVLRPFLLVEGVGVSKIANGRLINYEPFPGSSDKNDSNSNSMTSTRCSEAPQPMDADSSYLSDYYDSHTETEHEQMGYKCRICYTQISLSVTDHLDHVVKRHKLTLGLHCKLQKVPACNLCECENTKFEADPTEFTLHVFQCLQDKKQPIRARFNKVTFKAVSGSTNWYEQVDDVAPPKSKSKPIFRPPNPDPDPNTVQETRTKIQNVQPQLANFRRTMSDQDYISCDDLSPQIVIPEMIGHLLSRNSVK